MNNRIAFVAEHPGDEERAAGGIALVGSDGRLFQRMLSAAGLLRADAPPAGWHPELSRRGLRGFLWARSNHYVTNVLSEALPEDTTPTKRAFAVAAQRGVLADALTVVRPSLIVALGAIALEAFCGADYTISEARGIVLRAKHILPGVKVLPTFNPGVVRRDYRMMGTVVADLVRAGREAEDAENIVQQRDVEIWIEPSLGEMVQWWSWYGARSSLLTVDIETFGSTLITCVGFSADAVRAICVPFVDWRRPGASYWSDAAAEGEAWDMVAEWLASPIPKCMQGGHYDAAWLWGRYGLPIRAWEDDTMLAQHVLYPEEPKNLGFLGSRYGFPPMPWKAWRGGAEKRGA